MAHWRDTKSLTIQNCLNNAKILPAVHTVRRAVDHILKERSALLKEFKFAEARVPSQELSASVDGLISQSPGHEVWTGADVEDHVIGRS